MNEILPTRMILEAHVTAWKRWASTVDQREDGWESGYPQWKEFIAAAHRWIESGDTSDTIDALLMDLLRIDQYWEELDQVLMQYAAQLRAHFLRIFHAGDALASTKALWFLAKCDLVTLSFLREVYETKDAVGRVAAFSLMCDRLPRQEQIATAQHVIDSDSDDTLRMIARWVLEKAASAR